jgi:hypothetical protein
LKVEYTGSNRKSGFLHFSNVTIKNRNIITPSRQIVHDKANPSSHTISPGWQKVKKFGTNFDQLSFRYEAKHVCAGANDIQNRKTIWQ